MSRRCDMKIDTDAIATMTETNQNFSRVAKKADQYGEVIIFKNNRPKYKLVDLDRKADPSDRELTDDEKIDIYYMNAKAPCFIRDAAGNYIYLVLPVNFVV